MRMIGSETLSALEIFERKKMILAKSRQDEEQ
jgi:hypothetical protein